MTPGVLLCCCSLSASRFNALCIQRCDELEAVGPLWPQQGQTLRSKARWIFSFHSLQTQESYLSFEIWSFVNNYIFFFCFLNINQHLWETAAMMFIHIERQKSFRGLISFCPHLFRHHRKACLRVSQQKSMLTDKHTPPTAWNEDTASFTQRSLLFAIHRNWKHICHQTPYRHWALPRSYSLHRCRNY